MFGRIGNNETEVFPDAGDQNLDEGRRRGQVQYEPIAGIQTGITERLGPDASPGPEGRGRHSQVVKNKDRPGRVPQGIV